MADVLLVTANAPALPGASVQFTGLFEVIVTVPFSAAYAAEGVSTRPPLEIATAPVPDTFTCTGEPGSFPLIEMAAVSEAVVDGWNFTDIAQVAPDATVVPQLFETRKSAAFVPVIVIEESDRNDVPEFVSVIVLTALCVFTVCVPKFRLVGFNTTCGEFAELLASTVQLFGEVQPNRLEPAAAVVLKNNWPTWHVGGSDAPTVTGRVNG